jgi:ubiquitin carboxyl-terminal hydrolase 34
MKIDSDPTVPGTPERPQQPPAEPASEPRSSRVTINVRTPSAQPLDAIPSSPPSPSPGPPAALPTDAVKTSVEERETAMPANGTVSDTPLSLRLDSESPPIEIISVSAEDDDAAFDDDDSITMLDDSGRSLIYDPTLSFPFHDTTESYLETVIRLLTYLPTRKPTFPTYPP